MDLFGKDKITKLEGKVEELQKEALKLNQDIEAQSLMLQTPILTISFDGEKTPGEIGVIKDYTPDYIRLRARSWQSYLESDVTQDVIKKYVKWVCGGGLKLQSEPIKNILSDLGLDIDHEKFTTSVESRFSLFLKNRLSDYASESSINLIISEAVKNAYIGGDVLVIQRLEKGKQTIQIVDGSHIQSPWKPKGKGEGNKIIDGVEIDKRGKHIAYWVKKSYKEYERVIAKDKRGRKMAFLLYGMKYRINDTRGLPLIVAVMETLKMLDRYKNATVGSAEERQKIPFFFTHDKDSTGYNPMTDSIKATFTQNENESDTNYIARIQQLQGQIAETIQKTVYNLPNGADIKSLGADNEISFKDFFTTNVEIVCACIGIPPEIALSKYDSNFSASRAAIKDWEHTLLVERAAIGEGFYKPIYDLWLDMAVLTERVNAPGYRDALFSEDEEILESYRNSRWTGASVPHIDPEKEVRAERAKLGVLAEHIPLTTVEKATEAVNGGESISNMEQFIKEIEKVEKPEQPKRNDV